jgi:hypothetical protein|tara:strand:- start:444 stop:878 length:435 start_codon:yes stop_codon:yes gene_type:complete
LTRAGAIAQIDTRLSTITDPAFVGVYRGELLAISGTPVLAFWVDRRVSKAVTLSNAGSTTTFTIRAYFRMQTSPDVRESVELDLWDTMYEIDAALMGDANLGGNVSDSRLLEFVGGYVQMSGNMYRTVTVPYEVDILEEVTITP